MSPYFRRCLSVILPSNIPVRASVRYPRSIRVSPESVEIHWPADPKQNVGLERVISL